MKALVFAAGLGTRLRPLTNHLPKALVPVGGKPMLERVILRLKEAGCTDITVNIHHFGQQIIDFVQAHQSFGIDIHFSDERGELLDTGGGIRKARRWLEGTEPFIVHNADILTDLDIRKMYAYHCSRQAEATLLIGERQTSRYLVFNSHQRLCGWTNRSTGEVRPEGFTLQETAHHLYAFGGVHVFSPTLFKQMQAPCWEGKFSIIPFYLSVCSDVCIAGYLPECVQWFDIGKPHTLAEAEAWVRQSEE